MADPFRVKVYLVIQKDLHPRPGQPSHRVVAVKLTREAADVIARALPEAHVERHLASK